MIYERQDDRIIIYDKSQFCVRHILECGQVFRFERVDEVYWKVFSVDKYAEICDYADKSEIITDDVDYFVSYFDLDTDYNDIKQRLITKAADSPLIDAIEHGYGIRILKQDFYETVISFIISANNNIGRIKGIIERICREIGNKTSYGYAFPTLDALARCDEDFFKKCGCGYRSAYLVKTANDLLLLARNLSQYFDNASNNYRLNQAERLNETDALNQIEGFKRLSDRHESIEADAADNHTNSTIRGLDGSELFKLETIAARNELTKLMGVGNKVADCILLFGMGRTDVFPTDVWIKKVYRSYFDEGHSDAEIPCALVKRFGKDSGYAQQYLYYYERERGQEKPLAKSAVQRLQ